MTATRPMTFFRRTCEVFSGRRDDPLPVIVFVAFAPATLAVEGFANPSLRESLIGLANEADALIGRGLRVPERVRDALLSLTLVADAGVEFERAALAAE